MAEICAPTRALCRVRATLLDDLGNVASVENNSWVSDGLISAAIAAQNRDGASGELRDGCGRQRASFRDNNTTERYQITLEDSLDEPGLRGMLLGHDLIFDGPDVIGTSAVDQTDDDFEPARVALELWLKLWDGDSQNQTRPWKWVNFPGTYSWIPSDVTWGADLHTRGFVGLTFKNELWGDGPYGDVDAVDGQIGPIFNEAQVTSDPPASACGFAHIAPGS